MLNHDEPWYRYTYDISIYYIYTIWKFYDNGKLKNDSYPYFFKKIEEAKEGDEDDEER